MKLFLSREEKREVKKLKRIERNGGRRLFPKEVKKIEFAERLQDFHVSFIMSVIALTISILALIEKAF